MRRRAQRLPTALGAVLVLLASIARADNDGGVDRARESVRRGHRAMATGNPTQALEEYRAAEREAPDANLPYKYEAEALSALERWTEAIAAYEHYLRVKTDVHDAAQVRAQIVQIRRAHLEGVIDVVCTPAESELSLDDAPLGKSPVQGVRTIAGPHTLVARAAGYKDATIDIRVLAGTTTSIPCKLTPLASESKPVRLAPEQPPTPVRPRVGLILAISGVAVLAGSVIVDTTVLGGALDDFRASKNAGDGRAAELHANVERMQTGLLVAYPVGAVLTAAGAALWLWPTKSAPASVSVTPAGMRLDVRW